MTILFLFKRKIIFRLRRSVIFNVTQLPYPIQQNPQRRYTKPMCMERCFNIAMK